MNAIQIIIGILAILFLTIPSVFAYVLLKRQKELLDRVTSEKKETVKKEVIPATTDENKLEDDPNMITLSEDRRIGFNEIKDVQVEEGPKRKVKIYTQ